MENYNYKIESGIYPKYIIEYFTEICDKVIDDKEFIGQGWIVKLIEKEERKYRVISLPSTNIYFYAETELVAGIAFEVMNVVRIRRS